MDACPARRGIATGNRPAQLAKGGVLVSREDDGAEPPASGKKGAEASGRAAKAGAPKAAEGHVGNALRVAYEAAVREEVPSEFLDLLGKLA